MESRVKAKAKESTIIAAKMDEDDFKNMKKPVVIGQKADEETTKILEDISRQNSDQTRQDDSKKDLRSSSSSLEMMKKLENDKNSSKKAENIKKEEEKKKEKEGNEIGNSKNKKTTSQHVWDCGSTLYDSFELNSFKRQLDSAISASSARTMSMSHLPNRRLPISPEHTPPPPETSPSSSSGGKKQSNKISRSIQRLLKSVFFRPKNPKSLFSRSTPSSPVYNYKAGQRDEKDRYYVVYDKTGSLTTIPESTEKEAASPEINSLVRKTVSERFPASRVVGISCA